MASRLSVVIVQSNQQSSQRAAVEEALLIELMGAAGLDPVLVRSLEQLHHNTTDLLALQSLPPRFVICSWHSTEETLAQLKHHAIATAGAAPHQLEERSNVRQLIDRWQTMRADADVAVVQIGMGTATPPQRVASKPEPNAVPPSSLASPRADNAAAPADADLDALVDRLNAEHW